MDTIILATQNRHKITEISPVLRANGFDCTPQQEFFAEEVTEDGKSFIENALKKARFASKKTGLPALGDDSGLMVDALGGQPGIYSARYSSSNNTNASDSDNVARLLQELQGYHTARERRATYICVMVYVRNADDEDPLIGIGRLYGDILSQPRSVDSVGYDSVMWIPQCVKTMAEIPFEQKIKISHRTKALNEIIQQIKKTTNR
jgi:XTP/dITP diphosphohydrolase